MKVIIILLAILSFPFISIGQWQILSANSSALDRYGGISFVNDSTGFVTVTTYSNQDAFGSYILKTSNYGDSWDTVYSALTNIQLTEVLIEDVFFINEDIGWASGNLMPFILKTTNGGETWIQQNFNISGQPNFPFIKFFDENFGIALPQFDGQHAIYTEDGGSNWSERDSLTGYDVSFLNDCNFIISSSGRIKKNLDCELSFQTFPTSQQGSIPRRHGLVVHAFNDETWIFGAIGIIGNNNFASILRTTDAGQTFSIIDLFEIGNWVTCFEFLDESIGFTSVEAGPAVPCKVLKTIDGGLHWHCQETPLIEIIEGSGNYTYDNMFDIDCPSSEICYASGGQKLYRTFNGGGPLGQMWTSVSEIEETVLLDLSIFPNPASMSLSISTSQNFSPTTQIQLFDLSGRLILSEQIQSRSNKITIDVQDLASGIYTCIVSDKDQRYRPVKWVKE